MRRRIVGSMLAVAGTVALVFGLPLALFGTSYLQDLQRQRLAGDADRVVRLVEPQVRAGRTPDLTVVSGLLKHRSAEVRLDDGRTFTAGAQLGDADLTTSRLIRSGDGRVSVTVSEPRAALDEDIGRLWLLIGCTGALALALSGGLALVQARRIVEPLEDLALTADRLGSGDTGSLGHRYGDPELDRVSEVLDATSARITEMLAVERRFAQNASHQLRTPLAALSLRLEEIQMCDDPVAVKEEAAIALAQIDRLSQSVADLMAAAKSSGSTRRLGAIEVDLVVDQQLAEWAHAYRHLGRRLERAGVRDGFAAASPGGLAQVLATLVENSLVHGGGTTTITVRRSGQWLVVDVADEGPGVAPDLVNHVFERSVSSRVDGTGLGLSIARGLAEADGGRLELSQPSPPVFSVFLNAMAGADGARAEPVRSVPRPRRVLGLLRQG